MGRTFPSKGLLGLGCWLFVASALTAQERFERPSMPPNPPPAEVGRGNPNGQLPPQIQLPPYQPVNLPPMPTYDFKQFESQQKDTGSALRWIGLIVGALGAAAGGAGTWGAKQKNSVSPAAPPTTAPPTVPQTKTQDLGLGVDGKAGVWQREVPPWQK